MKIEELKVLATNFARNYIDKDIVSVDKHKTRPLGVKVILSNDSVLEVTKNSANLYFGSPKSIYQHDDMTHEWMEYIVSKSIGKNKEKVLNSYIEIALSDLVDFTIENDSQNLDNQAQIIGEDYEDTIAFFEEFSRHVNSLLTSKFDIIQAEVKNGDITGAEAEQKTSYHHNIFMKNVQVHINYFLDKFVIKKINEQGEEVYEFTVEQNQVYEALKDVILDLDFSLRQKLYTLDRIAMESEQE